MKWPHHGDDDDDAMAARTKLKFGSQILTLTKKCGQKHQIKQEVMQNTNKRQKRSATSWGGSSVQDCRRVGL
jgi:hypothetical protein